MLAEVPIPLDLLRARVLGLTGSARPLLAHLLGQLLVLHGPSDLRVVVCSARPELCGLRDVPHCDLLLTDPDVAADLGAPRPGVATVLVLDGSARWRRSPAVRDFLARAAAGSGSPAICLDEDAQGLPVECRQVVTVGEGTLQVDGREAAPGPPGPARVDPTGVNPAYLDRLITALTRLTDQDDTASALPERIGLADAGELSPSVEQIRRAWQQPELIALFGTGPDGPLRWRAERDGPHLLVAGTTGAGKSEFLQTLIVSLSCAAPPQRCSFLLIDYKGGAAFTALAGLPHVAGVITDLDGELGARALRSLRAELRRREQILTAGGAVDLASHRARNGAATPASLVIVVDEFATLAAELPGFLTGLLDVAQRGRSLGVHLVLATQRPAGVLSPAIRANLATRVCLRVTDPAESIDVIGIGDAAAIPPARPGRGIVRIGDTVTPFQTARVRPAGPAGVTVRPSRPGPVVPDRADGTPDRVATTGDPATADRTEMPAAGSGGSGVTDWVVALSRAASGSTRPEPPWCPALPGLIPPDLACPDGWATADRPDLGRTDLLAAPPGSVLVAGPPGSGRTSALRRLARVHAAAGGALLLMDAGAQLTDLARWPATLTRWDGADPALLKRQVGRLHDELTRRAGREVSTTPAGPELTDTRPGPEPPRVLVVIDGLETVTAALDVADYGASTAGLAEVIGRGPAQGIRVAASGDARAATHRLAGQFGTVAALSVDVRGEPRPGPAGRGRSAGDELQLWWEAPGGPPPAPAGQNRQIGPGGPAGWPELAGLIVAPLPERVGMAALPRPRSGAVPLGLGGDRAETVFLDLAGPGGGLLVAGPRRSGVSTTLRCVALGAAAAGIPVLRLLTRPAPGWPGVIDLGGGDSGAELERRLVEHHGPLLLVADGGTDDHPVGALLQRFLAAAGPGQYLLLGTRLDLAARSHRGLIAETATFRTGVLLHATPADGPLLDVVLPRRTGTMPPGRGHLVAAGVATGIQVATPPE